MRFAWLRTRDQREPPVATPIERLIVVAYNVIWWIPIVLPVLGVISYRSGLVGFLVITVARALLNGYRNNLMEVAAAERWPLRQP